MVMPRILSSFQNLKRKIYKSQKYVKHNVKKSFCCFDNKDPCMFLIGFQKPHPNEHTRKIRSSPRYSIVSSKGR